MSEHSLYSAPQEPYHLHILRCVESFEVVFPQFCTPLMKVLGLDQKGWKLDELRDVFRIVVEYHDLGKLTKKWQENLGTGKKLPAHAPIGAAYLWHILPEEVRAPLSFAVAIHHTDRGLLGDNIERPDVKAIMDGIIDDNGQIIWCENIEDAGKYAPDNLHDLSVIHLKQMAIGLRKWAKGCSILEQHHRRLCATLSHHVLKLCDISAATKRTTFTPDSEKDLYGGWLMVKNIHDYVSNISARKRHSKLIEELERFRNILLSSCNPEKIILFGSLAGGSANSTSDIDMIVVMDTDRPFLDRTKYMLKLLRPKVGIDLLVYTPAEFSEMTKTRSFFVKEMVEKGWVIYERRSEKVDQIRGGGSENC